MRFKMQENYIEDKYNLEDGMKVYISPHVILLDTLIFYDSL